MPIYTNKSEGPVRMRIWQMARTVESEDENTCLYVHFDQKLCSLYDGTPFPEDSTVLHLIVNEGQTLYGCTDDKAMGGFYVEPLFLPR